MIPESETGYSRTLKYPDINKVLLYKYPTKYGLLSIMEHLKSKYESFRYVYRHRITGKIVDGPWQLYAQYPGLKTEFQWNFLWKSHVEFKRVEEIFEWPL